MSIKLFVFASAVLLASISAKSGCLDTEVAATGADTATKITKIWTNENGNAIVTMASGSYYWIDGSQNGARNLYQFALVAWQMGTTVNVESKCTWSATNQPMLVIISSKQ